MAKPGYQAVALEPAQADKLRQLARYLSVTRQRRVTLSEAVGHIMDQWASEHVFPGPNAVESLAAFLERSRGSHDDA